MQKKIAIGVGIFIVYLILLFAFGPAINIVLAVGGLAYMMYMNNR